MPGAETSVARWTVVGAMIAVYLWTHVPGAMTSRYQCTHVPGVAQP